MLMEKYTTWSLKIIGNAFLQTNVATPLIIEDTSTFLKHICQLGKETWNSIYKHIFYSRVSQSDYIVELQKEQVH